MKLHFISAPKDGPLRKQIGMADGKDRSFPNAYYLSSYEEEVTVDADGLKDYRDLLAKHAAQGNALMKGTFPRELVCESRKGLIANEGTTRLLILDVDGIAMDGVHVEPGQATSDDVKRIAESVIKLLPEELHCVSYVALASSSFGTAHTKVSIHIHMFLDTPVDVGLLKQWLHSLNYTCPSITEKLSLTKQKISVKSIVDQCLAEQSRIVYIAPPFFGPKIKNPFSDNGQRAVVVEKEKSVLQLEPLLEKMDELMGWIDEQQNKTLQRLQKKAGVNTRKRKMTKVYVNGEKSWVVEDPERSTLTYHSETDKLVAYNRPGDTTGPYFVWKHNPEVVHSIKPSELPEMFSVVDPQAYEIHTRRYGGGHTTQVVHGKRRNLNHYMFIDQNTDKYYVMSHDPDDDIITEIVQKSRETAEQFMLFKNSLVPEPVPTWYIEFDPKDTRSLIKSEGNVTVNKFIPSSYMVDETEHELAGLMSYGHGHLLEFYCPTIYQIIFHMLGNDDEAYEHFINWFAYIFQTREKTGKAWLVHGTNGTGKGLFFNRIVTALFTETHCNQQTLPEIIDDQFNGWMEHCIFLMIDEFNLENASKSTVSSANELKRMITEPIFSMRKMQRERVKRRQHINFLLGTNDIGALSMEDKRRVNVAPRQPVMLDEVFPDINDQAYFDPIVDGELQDFATFLRGFKASAKQARTMLRNEAKIKASEAGMNAVDRFFTALREGNFEVFAEILDAPERIEAGHEKLAQLKRVKKLLRHCLPHVNSGNEVKIDNDDLRAMYSYLADKPISTTAFGRMIGKQELQTVRTGKPLGVDRAKPSKPKSTVVTWHLNDEVMLYQLVQQANEIESTISQSPNNHGPAPVMQDTM